MNQQQTPKGNTLRPVSLTFGVVETPEEKKLGFINRTAAGFKVLLSAENPRHRPYGEVMVKPTLEAAINWLEG